MAIIRLRWFVLVALFVAIADGPSAVAGTFPGRNGVLVFDAVDQTTRTVQIFQVSGRRDRAQAADDDHRGRLEPGPDLLCDRADDLFRQLGPGHYSPEPHLSDEREWNGPTARRRSLGANPCLAVGQQRSGSALAVVQYGNGGESSIATMKTNGANRKVIANATRLQSYGAPEYAPSGGRLAFYRVTYNENGQGIAKSDLFVRNGTRNTNITARSSAQFFGASWAPNGRTLIAIRGQRTIVSIRPNGTGVRVLTTVSGAETGVADAIYSPDGTKIAYLQCTGDCGDPELRGQGSIWVMNANGSGKRRVFNGGNRVQPADRLAWRAS